MKTVILSFSALLCLSAPTVASSWQTGLAKRPEKNLVQPAVPGSAVFPWQACALAPAGLLLLLGPVACIIYLRHRRTSRALREKEKLFRAMVKFTHDWELWLDPNGALLYSSPSCERITGFRDEDFRRDPDLLSQIIAVMMLDLDDFKQINDTTGHAKGDELLVMLTARLRQQLHPGDMLARLGGDESILLLNNIGSATLAANRAKQKSLLAERLLKALFQSSQLTIISKSIFFGAMPGFAS